MDHSFRIEFLPLDLECRLYVSALASARMEQGSRMAIVNAFANVRESGCLLSLVSGACE